MNPKALAWHELDNVVVTSYNNVRRYFIRTPMLLFSIQVKVHDIKMMDGAIGQATGVFGPSAN